MPDPRVMPHSAMILAAGFGLRMRPLTDHLPKPLLQVGGEAMLDIVLERLMQAGVENALINTHYLADKIKEHVQPWVLPRITLVHEPEILDTGGGVKNALPQLGQAPFFVINSDLPWLDGAEPALKRLARYFDPVKMDALLLLMPLSKARGFDRTKGDFFLEDDGTGFGVIRRANTKTPRSYVFISAQIIHPRLYEGVPDKIFSNNVVWDKAEKENRLYGLVHDAGCYHVGTPQDFEEANRLLASGEGW